MHEKLMWASLKSVTFLTDAAKNKSCASGWLQDGDHCYYSNSTAVSWQRAADTCSLNHAYLVNLGETMEQTLILNMRPYNLNSAHWIGFYKKVS